MTPSTDRRWVHAISTSLVNHGEGDRQKSGLLQSLPKASPEVSDAAGTVRGGHGYDPHLP
jgi:hypothetical protein